MLNRSTPPETNNVEKINTVLPERKLLSNGIPVCILNNGEQEVIRLDLVFKGGRYQQHYPLQAMLTNKMLQEGSNRYSSAEIAEKLDYYGAWLDLYTSCEASYVTLYSLNKYFPQTLDILETIIKEPTFPEKELNTLLESQKQQFLINSTKVDYISQKYLQLSLFGNTHPNGIITTFSDYLNFERRYLIDFHSSYYNAENCKIYLSGKVTPSMYEGIENIFGRESWGVKKEMQFPSCQISGHLSEKRLFMDVTDAMQSSVRIGMLTLKRSHADYLKMKVVTTLLGGYFGSRLMSNIREEKGYTYGIGCNLHCYPDTGLFMITTETDNKNVDSVIKEVYKEIEVLKHEAVEEEELAMVKNYMIGNLSREYEGILSIADLWIMIDIDQLGENYLQNSLDTIKDITSQEIMELAQKYLRNDHLTEVISGKKIYNKA